MRFFFFSCPPEGGVGSKWLRQRHSRFFFFFGLFLKGGRQGELPGMTPLERLGTERGK
jgi:hypothetical protein